MSIRGAAGGGGGSSFKATPDNLRSLDTFEGVLGLASGPLKGPKRGLKSIKVDGTAIENETGEPNFGDFTATFGDGDPTKFPQKVELKLGAGASPVPVQLTLGNTNTAAGQGSPGPWITKTVSNTGANFLDLRFVVSQLYKQDKTGIYNETLTIEIQLKPTAKTTWINPTITTPTGTYQEQGINTGLNTRLLLLEKNFDIADNWNATPPNFTVTGKTTSASVYELRLSVPNTGNYAATGWDVRCRLLERATYDDGSDTDNHQEKRAVAWESISAVYSSTMGDHEDWRGLAWMQIYGKASDQLTGVPEITGEYDTKIVQVPPSTIFNPDTRQYAAGVWDGSWSYSFTNDPAWCIADAISDPLSGLAAVATGSYLNKWDALEASKWFGQLVSDGDGGTHPRFSMNLAISETQKAEELIRYMAGAVGALAWDEGNGQWRMKVDKPENPVDIFTLDSIEGEFVYNHTDVDTRFNDITGKFKNAVMDYREDSVRLFDDTSIGNIGRKPTTIALVGCTNRQEALRRVKLRLRTAVYETRMVTFTTNRRGRNVNMLDTILIADGDLGDSSQLTNSRVVAISADRMMITVRDPVYIATGVSYTVKFSIPNSAYSPDTSTQPTNADWRKPTVVTSRNVTNTTGQRGSTRDIYLDAALPTNVAENLSVALDATGLTTLPRPYRVLSVVVNDDNERISINAIEIDSGKWDASDGVSPQDSVFQDLRGVVLPPVAPTFGDMLSLHTTTTSTTVIRTILAQWERPPSSYVAGFRVRHAINGDVMTTVVDRTQFPQWELVSPTPGIHHVEVCSIGRNGLFSEPLSQAILVSSGPDETRASLGSLWGNGDEVVLSFPYVKGDLASNQGAMWIYISDSAWDGITLPPTLPVQENTYWRQVKDATASHVDVYPVSFTINADYTGAVLDGELPKLGQLKYIIGAADVTTSATWAVTTVSGCTVSINSTGGFTIDTVTALNAYAEFTGTFDSVGILKRVPIAKLLADAPADIGGGPGAPSATISSGFPTITSSGTYPTDPVPIATVKSSSSGKLQFAADIFYSVLIPPNGTRTAALGMKIVYRPASGGSWTDVNAEVVGSTATVITYVGDYGATESTEGEVTVSPTTITGLTASTDYEFGIKLRRYSGNSAAIYPYGAVTATQVA